MKTTLEILQAYGCRQHNDDIDRDDAAAAMREFAIEVIDHILTRGDGDMIYCSTDEGGSMFEALYDYEKFTKLKEELK